MNETTTTTEVLHRAELFADVSEDTLAEIAALSERRDFEEGDPIYELGESADDIFVLVSGRVRFTLGVGNRPQSSGSIMTSRMVFGWAALVDYQPRRVATALCLEPSTVLALNGKKLLDVFEKDPRAGFLVMRRIAEMIARNFMN